MPAALKDLARLSRDVASRIMARLEELADNPRPAGATGLKGEDLPGFRLRAGNYRALYTIDDKMKTVTVYAVGHRREIYRKR